MLTLRNLLLAKTEAVYGTDSAPAASDFVLVNNLNISVKGDLLERKQVSSSLSQQSIKIGQKFVDISFSVFIRGKGSTQTPPEAGSLLQACGMGEVIGASSVTYSPVSSNFKSCTIYAYLDGIIHKITGCRGTFELVCEAGEFARLEFTLNGIYQIPVDGALASANYSSIVPPVVYSAGFVMNGYQALISSLQFSINNRISSLKDVNSNGRIEITGRNPQGSLNPEAVSEAVKPFWNEWQDSTAQTITMTIGQAAGNKLDISIPNAVYSSMAWADREGIRIYSIPFRCAGITGNDEINLIFS